MAAPWDELEALAARVVKLEVRMERRDELLQAVGQSLAVVRREITQIKQDHAHQVGDVDTALKKIEHRLDEHARTLTEAILE